MHKRAVRSPPEAVTIPGPAGDLEGRVDDVAAGVIVRAVGVVLHPHPLHGGTMHNKVAYTLARTLQALGVPAVRFNFRGVGASAGTYDGGRGELDDAVAAADWARRRWHCESLWLAGFSFGAAAALHAAARARPRKLVTVAPPVGRLRLEHGDAPPCPWLIVQGDADELVDAGAVREWAAGWNPAPRVSMLAGADHFFHGRLTDLREVVSGFLLEGEEAGEA